MPNLSLHVKGLDKLERAVERFPQQVGRGLRTATKGALEMLRGGLADYPPATQANRKPGVNGYSWYERGYGVKTVTGRGYPTSETLGRSWNSKIKGVADKGVIGVVGTRASYARAVQDADKQAKFHAARGWPTAQGVMAEKGDAIRRLFADVIDRMLRRLGE